MLEGSQRLGFRVLGALRILGFKGFQRFGILVWVWGFSFRATEACGISRVYGLGFQGFRAGEVCGFRVWRFGFAASGAS